MAEYFEENENGKYKVIEKKNGIKTRLLIEPSDSYKEKMALRQVEASAKFAIEQKEQQRKDMIKNELESFAIERLIANGLFDEDGNMK